MPFKAFCSEAGSVKMSGRQVPVMLRREMPMASSKAALAKTTVPSSDKTATSVASKSSVWKRLAAFADGESIVEAAPLAGARRLTDFGGGVVGLFKPFIVLQPTPIWPGPSGLIRG
jgi:hypothetical protein